MKPSNTAKRLKISELAKKSGVTIPTIRHYLKEGLLPQPVKTGQTMAYYDPECIDRIQLIKRLQRERFLPIEVIKRVINAGEVFTEESKIGQILTRSDLFRSKNGTMTIGELTAATAYPVSKIKQLQREGVITPDKTASGHFYDALDAELIRLIRKTEDAGLPSDFILGTIKMYSQAVESLVKKNTQRMLARLVTDLPVESMGRVLTATEDSLDALILLLRRKTVRRINEAAMAGLNTMAEKLDTMFFFPVAGRHLPITVPSEPGERIFYNFCTGDYSSVPDDCRFLPEVRESRWSLICGVAAWLCQKDARAAVHLIETRLPEPADDPLANSIAALAYVYDAAFSAGITGPMKKVKKAWLFLGKSTGLGKSSTLDRMLTQYACGAVYTALPDIFGFAEKGQALLAQTAETIRGKLPRQEQLPKWAALTLTDEILPAMEHRINRILARCYAENLMNQQKEMS